MKGIIVEYIEEKGFGFIKDENEEIRFFHISRIKERQEFLNNITAYYYSDWVERKCYVVTFTPLENEKGLNALNITLTNQIFNDKSYGASFEAIITDIKYNQTSLTRTVSGIKKGMSAPFGATAGSNGTYRLDYPEVLKELTLYFRRVDDIGFDTIDVREVALTVNARSKITDKFVFNLKNQLTGKTIDIFSKNNEWHLKNNLVLKV